MPRVNPLSMSVILVTGVALVGGCNLVEPDEPLTVEEAEALFEGLLEVVADTTAEPISVTENGAVFACARGGEMALTIDFGQEVDGDIVRANTDMELDPAGCVVWSEGYQFTLDGNPSVRLEMDFANVGASGSFQFDMTITGALDWRLDDRFGTCAFDLRGGATLDPSSVEGSEGKMTGMLCGLEVDFDSLAPPI